MFKNCKSITSIDMSSIYNDNAQHTDEMFNDCSNLKSIKNNKFKNTQFLSNNFFFKITAEGTITISEDIKNKVEKQIPKNRVIEIDYKKNKIKINI